MCSTTTIWKQLAAILGLSVALAWPVIARAGELRVIQKAGSSNETSPKQNTAPVPGATPVPNIGAAGNVPALREATANNTAPAPRAPGGAQIRKVDPAAGVASRNGGLAAMAKSNTRIAMSGQCALGFVKEIKPDHPGGMYVCRLPALPPCTGGWYYHPGPNLDENRFKYKCSDAMEEYISNWSGGPEVCPQGWTAASRSDGYNCSSSQLRCSSGHQLDGVHVAGVSGAPKGNVVYSHRCKDM